MKLATGGLLGETAGMNEQDAPPAPDEQRRKRLWGWIAAVWLLLVGKSLLLQWLVAAYEVERVGPVYIWSVALIAAVVLTVLLLSAMQRDARKR